MAVDVVMPQMGESIFEGTVTKWLKKPGDKVERDEPLFEISTDKVDAEIPAPAAGVLREIKVAEGTTVPIQTVVAVIDVAGAASAAPPQDPAQAPEGKTPAQTTAQPAAQTAAKASQPEKPSPTPAPPRPPAHSPSPSQGESSTAQGQEEGISDSALSSPLVRRLAQENHIDLTRLHGTGAGGRISKKDVLAAIAAAPAAGSPPLTKPACAAASLPSGSAEATAAARPTLETAVARERIYFGHYEVQPLSVMRQRIAEHMVVSKRVSPHVYSIDEADMTRIAQLRAAAQHEFAEKHQTKLTFMGFFVRACVDALRDFPTVNASLDGTNMVLHGEINVGIAVALDWGLIVPVIKNAEEKNFLGLQRAINDLGERARAKKLKPEEVQESTFSITNPGIFGGLMGLPIINQPNVAILGIGAVQKRAVVVDDAIAIRSMVYLTLSYDHRVVDGAVAHQFMGHVKKRLETWTEDIL
jgi:2-oxoglutarate dehydrogenase E2 component (dihydrolipoamide succinyltransferase)